MLQNLPINGINIVEIRADMPKITGSICSKLLVIFCPVLPPNGRIIGRISYMDEMVRGSRENINYAHYSDISMTDETGTPMSFPEHWHMSAEFIMAVKDGCVFRVNEEEYALKSGEILLRGTDIRKIPLAALMDNISMVFQRVYLFQDTVYNNIALGRPDASREEVIEAAKKPRCYDFIMELRDGFDTVIGEGGASLSGGQAQRLSIARCILKDSPIVILDEATASVDADNESYIQQAISELCKGKTLLVIAHRLNTIAHADCICVIKDGEIAESGDHKSLMDMGGIYHNMVTKRAVSTGWKN